jgi:voltage-gated potassium channel
MRVPAAGHSPLRHRLHTVIFEADTPLGKAFDIALLLAILVSVVAVCLESVASIDAEYGDLLRAVEWGLTIAFTIEYLLRLCCVKRPLRYAFSFYGLVDLLAILPTYLSLVISGARPLTVIRALRLLRVFRVLKLGHFVAEAEVLMRALIASRRKILVFLGTVLTLILILGTLMYLVEGDESGFTSIPESVYWAIVTLTTVGYGDIAPATVLGKFIASFVMILGYGIIAVPTGIVGVEIYQSTKRAPPVSTQACPDCSREGHDPDARYCKHCGASLHPEEPAP